MANRYVDGLPPPRRIRPTRGASLLWAAIFLLLMAIWAVMQRGGPDWLATGLFAGVAVVVLAIGVRTGGFVRGGARRVVTQVQGVEMLLLRGRIDHAVQAARAALATPMSGYARGQVLVLLARAAEAAGDFAEAAAVYGLAWDEIQRAPVAAIFKAQLLPVVAARRAFALAAEGRVDDAAAVLRAATHRDALPAAQVLESRAGLLIEARRGDAAALLARLEQDRVIHRNGFAHRERVLAHVLEVMARAKLSGAARGAAVVGGDPALRRWILRAVPEAAAVMGVEP